MQRPTLVITTSIGIVCVAVWALLEHHDPAKPLTEVSGQAITDESIDRDAGPAFERTSAVSMPAVAPFDVLVVDSDGKAISGATVTIGFRPTSGPWTTLGQHASDSEGVITIASVDDDRDYDILVRKDGYVPLFVEQTIGKRARGVVATMDSGRVIRGIVRSKFGPVGGANVCIAAGTYRMNNSGNLWFEGVSCVEFQDPMDPSALGQALRCESHPDGTFRFDGILPVGPCTIYLDDHVWTMRPAHRLIRPAEDAVVLEVHRSTGLNMIVSDALQDHLRRLGSKHLTIVATNAAGSLSFSVPAASPSTRMDFSAPDAWTGKVEYGVSIVPRTVAARLDRASGLVGQVHDCALSLDLADPTDDRNVVIDLRWADGLPCEDETVSATLEHLDGSVSSAKVHATSPGNYRLFIPSSAIALTVVPESAWKGLTAVPTVDLTTAREGSTLVVMLPPSADIVLVTPTGQSTSVIIEGPAGAEARIVKGVARFRAVAPGRITAFARVGGERIERTADITGSGEFYLDFVNR